MSEEIKQEATKTELQQMDSNLAEIAREMQKTFRDSEASKKELMDKVSKDLDVCLKANNDLQLKLAEQKSKQEEQDKVIKAFERFASSKGGVKTADGEEVLNKDLQESFEKLIKCRDQNVLKQSDPIFMKHMALKDDVQIYGYKYNPIAKQYGRQVIDTKYLRTDQADSGGLLIAPEMTMQIFKRGTEYSPIRQYANVMQTYSNVIQFPVRNVLTTSYWEYEAADVTTGVSNSLYAREDIHMKRLSVQSVVTLEDLQDSPFDMPSLISADVTESFAQAEGNGFINGTGVNQVEGILVNPNVIVYNSKKTGVITADDLKEMMKSIKWNIYGQPAYEKTFIMNKFTFLTIWELKDGQGRYMFDKGELSAGQPATICGEKYIIAPDMPNIGSGATPIVMGDLKRGYTIVDRMQMYMIRDELTFPGKVKFTFIRRLGGKVVMGEALVKCLIG